MRILFVTHDFLPNHPAGTEIYTWQLAVRVKERGHDCHVFTTEKDISRPHLSVVEREWDGLPVHELTNNLFYDDFRETWDFPPAVEAFGRMLDELRPDVVHVMHLLYLSVGCVEEAARRGIPVVYTLHDYWLQCARFGQRVHADGEICHTIDFERCGTCLARLKFAQSSLERRAAKWIAGVRSVSGVDLGGAARGAVGLFSRSKDSSQKEGEVHVDPQLAAARSAEMAERDGALRERLVPAVDRFIAPSRFLRERFLEWGIPAEKIDHVEYGLELAPYTGFERTPSDTLRVAFLGTLAPHKGPHLVFEAWERLPKELREGASLTVFGPTDPRTPYVARLEELAQRSGGRLGGGLDREAVSDALRSIDLLVVPSTWYENSPLTIHEARATRTPLLVSDLGGMAELVRPGIDGWCFRVGDVADLARHLQDFLGDPAHRASLALDHASKDMRTSAEEMDALYGELLSARGTGPGART